MWTSCVCTECVRTMSIFTLNAETILPSFFPKSMKHNSNPFFLLQILLFLYFTFKIIKYTYVFFHFNYFLFLNQKLCFKYVQRSTENRKWFEWKQQRVRNNLYSMSEQNQIWTTRANFTFTNETITLPRFLPQHYQIQLLCILPTNYFFLQIKNHASN